MQPSDDHDHQSLQEEFLGVEDGPSTAATARWWRAGDTVDQTEISWTRTLSWVIMDAPPGVACLDTRHPRRLLAPEQVLLRFSIYDRPSTSRAHMRYFLFPGSRATESQDTYPTGTNLSPGAHRCWTEAMQDANFRELHFWNCLENPKREPNATPWGELSRRRPHRKLPQPYRNEAGTGYCAADKLRHGT
jgi:hypothetical protein